MPDVFTKAKRSEVMSRIRGRGNKETELALAKLLRAARITGWRRQVRLKVEGSNTSPRPSPQKDERSPQPSPDLRPPSPVPTGEGQRGEGVRVRPDFMFRKERVVIFVDGCFWHGCPKHSNMPVNNRAFWKKKLTANKKRDVLVTRTLRHAGWQVVRIWECALRKHPQSSIRRILRALKG